MPMTICRHCPRISASLCGVGYMVRLTTECNNSKTISEPVSQLLHDEWIVLKYILGTKMIWTVILVTKNIYTSLYGPRNTAKKIYSYRRRYNYGYGSLFQVVVPTWHWHCTLSHTVGSLPSSHQPLLIWQRRLSVLHISRWWCFGRLCRWTASCASRPALFSQEGVALGTSDSDPKAP